MRYGYPSLRKVLDDVFRESPDSVIVFPLYPHYASSTTGSVNELTMSALSNKIALPELKIAGQFYNHPLYLEAVAARISKYDLSEYGHILFSYHGLPLRQIRKIHPEKDCNTCNWMSPFTDDRLSELAGSGCKKVLVVAPSFIADCLETIMEIGEEYASHFKSCGGYQLDLVPDLNDDEKWADALIKIAGL